jgi:mannose-6-phosphate isomerase-like protein (cupin superfamily)
MKPTFVITAAAALLAATVPHALAADLSRGAAITAEQAAVAHTPFGDIRIVATAAQTNGVIGAFVTDEVPASQGPAHVHTREAELYYVIEGSYRFYVGDDTFDVGPGGTVSVPIGVSSRYDNVGTTQGHMLVTELPGGFEQFFLDIDRTKADTPAKIWALEKARGIVDSSLEQMAAAAAQ